MHILYLPPTPPAFIQQVQQVQTSGPGQPRFLQVEVRNGDLTPSREEVLVRARREAAGRSWFGEPRIVAETPTASGLSVLVEFPPQVLLQAPMGAPRVPAVGVGVALGAGRPSWVLVVPAENIGNRAGWATGDWSRTWMVPLRSGGMRLVPTAGDSEDRETLSPAMLLDPSSATVGMSALARKYGAPAVALVRLETDGVMRAWVMRGGNISTGVADAPADQEGRRRVGGELLVSLLSRSPTIRDDEQSSVMAADEHISPMLSVTARRGGQMSVLCDTTDADEQAEARRIMRGLPGFQTLSNRVTEDGLVMTGTWAGNQEELEGALASAGATIIN